MPENSASDQLLYLGHASLRLTTREGKVIYIDPYAGTPEAYSVPADLILVTHAHYDHFDLAKVQHRNPYCQVITHVEALANGEHQTFDLGYVKIQAVEAGCNPNHDIHECVGYILTLSSGVKIYVAGDTSITPQMPALAAEHLDYAFFPCDGVYNMDAKTATEAANLVQAAHSVPYHTKPGALFDEHIAADFSPAHRLIVKPGETLKLKPSSA